MNLAAILTIYLLSMGSPGVGWSSPRVRVLAAQQTAGQVSSTPQSQPSDTAAQPPAPASQDNKPAQPAPSAAGSASDSADQAKPGPQRTQRRKKKNVPCPSSPTALNPAPANPGNTTNRAGTGPATEPCPPPKKVVRNGGSEEPSIQLVGGTNADHASQQRSTDQLAAATDENLKKIAGRQLTANQQEMVNQVKQFMDQSKTAVAAGDLARGHNLAEKAHLLSEELVKP